MSSRITPDMEPTSGMASTSAATLILYGRDGCHLCDDARSILEAIMVRRAEAGLPTATIGEIDITTDEALHRAFVATIPVVEMNGLRLELATSPLKLQRLVEEALDRPAEHAHEVRQ